jgi:hypothetical protein
MNLLQITLLVSLAFSSLARANDNPAALAKAIAEKMNKVEKYSADVLIKVDIDFVKIEERRAQVFFEQPDKFDIKAKGIALIPKKGTEMEYLQLLNGDFTAIYEKTEVIDGITTQVIKVIPLGSDSDIVLAQLWIDEEHLRIERMQTFTKSTGSYLVDFSYTDHPYDLPAMIRVEFDVKNMSLPASMTGDLESLSKKLEKKGMTKGVVILEYSNYKVN